LRLFDADFTTFLAPNLRHLHLHGRFIFFVLVALEVLVSCLNCLKEFVRVLTFGSLSCMESHWLNCLKLVACRRDFKFLGEVTRPLSRVKLFRLALASSLGPGGLLGLVVNLLLRSGAVRIQGFHPLGYRAFFGK
jgi:hypothetical protein